MTNAQLKQFITEYTDEVWNRGNVAAMERYYAPDYAHHDVSRPDVRTLADYAQWARDLQAALSGLHVAIADLVADEGDDKAVKRWTATGRHTGELAGIAPTQQQVSFSGVSVYHFVDGQIVESWYVYDLFGLLQQLRTLPAATQPAHA